MADRMRTLRIHRFADVRRALVLSVVLLSLPLAGCLGINSDDEDSQLRSSLSDTPPSISPGKASETTLGVVAVNEPVGLPVAFSNEPSLTITDSGTIAVIAPAGDKSNPTVVTHGGYLWASRDDGATYDLQVTPKDPELLVGDCACDTDVTTLGDAIVASTMYWTVHPFFGANIITSEDAAQSWEVTNPAAAQRMPIDRQWLTPTSDGGLYLSYGEAPTFTHLTGVDPRDTWVQYSQDGGQTWGIAHALPTEGNDHTIVRNMRPTVAADGTLLAPLQSIDRSDFELQNLVAISRDQGQTFEMIELSDPYPSYATFDFSIDAGDDDTIVAAWSAPSSENGPNKLHIRISEDAGASWHATSTLDLPGNAMQPWVAARDDGTTAIAYYHTPINRPVSRINHSTPWAPQAVILNSPDAEEATVVVNLSTQATYHGPMCNISASCSPDDPTRTPMREFLSADWAPDGDLFVAWTDARQGPDDRGQITVTQIDLPSKGDVGTSSESPPPQPHATNTRIR